MNNVKPPFYTTIGIDYPSAGLSKELSAELNSFMNRYGLDRQGNYIINAIHQREDLPILTSLMDSQKIIWVTLHIDF